MVRKYDSMYIQALDIISSLGLSPQPTSEGSPMYAFEYKNATMFIDEGESDHDIDLSCSVYLSGTEDEQKQILDNAKDMAEDDLTEFDIHYVGDGLAFIALYLRVKESRHKLYKKHLLAMMDKLVDGYITLSCAISLIKYTQSSEFIESITNKQN